jgi:hypothetical protein
MGLFYIPEYWFSIEEMNLDLCSSLKHLIIIFSLAGKSYAQSADKVVPDTTLHPTIDHHFNKYSANGKNLRTFEILDHLSSIDSTAFNQYTMGKRAQRIGVALLSGGAAFVIVGDIILLAGTLNNISGFSNNQTNNTNPAGVTFLIVGGGLVIAGIAKCILGGQEKQKAVKSYNQTINLKKKSVGFYINPGLTGLSVGLRF